MLTTTADRETAANAITRPLVAQLNAAMQQSPRTLRRDELSRELTALVEQLHRKLWWFYALPAGE